jgi:hypothetical protein
MYFRFPNNNLRTMELTSWLRDHGYESTSTVSICVHSLCDTLENLYALHFEDFVTSGLKVGVARSLWTKIDASRPRIQRSTVACESTPQRSEIFEPTLESRGDLSEDDFCRDDDSELIMPPMAMMLTQSRGRRNFQQLSWVDSASPGLTMSGDCLISKGNRCSED